MDRRRSRSGGDSGVVDGRQGRDVEVEVGAADGAGGVGAEPGVDAGRVEGVAADGGEQPDGVSVGELGQAHRALRRRLATGGVEAQHGERRRDDGGVQPGWLRRRRRIGRVAVGGSELEAAATAEAEGEEAEEVAEDEDGEEAEEEHEEEEHREQHRERRALGLGLGLGLALLLLLALGRRRRARPVEEEAARGHGLQHRPRASAAATIGKETEGGAFSSRAHGRGS